MPEVPHPASKGAINRAGEDLRRWWTDISLPADLIHTEPTFSGAFTLVVHYRMGFQVPLDKTAIGLRKMVANEGHEVVVTQRLKRMPTIIDKLARYPQMNLARMHDIGGCRAILPSESATRAVVRRVLKRWEVIDVYDYIAGPKATGYRAIHVVVRRDGRPIEIQLRTPTQQAWAVEVEGLAQRIVGFSKDGGGPDVLVRFMRLAAGYTALMEAGAAADEGLAAEIRELWPEVQPFFDTGITE